VALLGPNGAGKSTAIALLLGLRRPDAGSARLFGLDPRRADSRRLLGVTPQETAFPSTLHVRELVDFVRAHYDRPLGTGAVCERFQLRLLMGRQLGGLSGGERRRVALALAFAGNPELAVLDEPTAGLDREARHVAWEALRAYAGRGGSILLTTHYLEEAEALAERVVLINSGKIVGGGPLREIKAAAGQTLVTFRAGPGMGLQGVDVHGVDRHGADVHGADLHGGDRHGGDRHGGDLHGAVRDGEFLRILTEDAAAAVERLIRAGVPLVDLQVRPLTLEEALALYECAP
jgi:ABC-2 type transport system ATP-binding protein